jgi:UDP-glucose 4-epimerase
VAGLVTLLEVMDEHGIKNLVFSSSCTVYGEPDALPITENSPIKPAESPYGETKQMCEIIIKGTTAASDDLKSLALRYFNPIGAHPTAKIGELPNGVPSNLLPLITQTVAGIREKITVYGNDYDTPDGSCIRDYIHVVDLAKAHVKALEHLDKQSPKYYDTVNIGTGNGNSVLEVINTFEKVTGEKVNYEIGPRRAGDVVKIYASVDKAKSTLGWQAEKTLEEALADAWRWQQTLSS